MPKYNGKEFNAEVFEAYSKTLPSTKENSLVQGAVLNTVNKYGSKLSEQAGGNYIVEPIKGRIGGNGVNYDGETDITAASRGSFKQGKVAIGRANAWEEYDFARDITSTNWLAEASEINEWWDEKKQHTILKMLKGIFASTANNFGTKHTYEVAGNLGADTLNRASQRVLGDKKRKLQTMFTHSMVSTNLEGLNLIEFLKYTDANGITRPLDIGTYNGKLVIVDDEMPTEDVAATYATSTDTTVDTSKTYYTRSGSSGNYTYTPVANPTGNPSTSNYYELISGGYTNYTSYLMENGFFEYEDLGVMTPYEVGRNASEKGGKTTLYSRKRFILVPKYISFTKSSMASLSPTDAELENGSNWEPVNDGAAQKTYIDDKLIPIVAIKSRG